MYKQLAVSSEEVSKNVDKYLDDVSGGRPVFIKHRDKYTVALGLGVVKQLVTDVTFRVEVTREVDDSYILTTDGFDIIATGKTLEEAQQDLVEEFRGYVQDYFEEVEIWSKDKHRASQLKELVFILITESDEELMSHFVYSKS